jgi:hypothetical protein
MGRLSPAGCGPASGVQSTALSQCGSSICLHPSGAADCRELEQYPEKLGQSAPPTPEMGGALFKRCLMDRHYSHAVTTQADVVSRRHLQVAFPRDVSRDAGGNDTPTHEVRRGPKPC